MKTRSNPFFRPALLAASVILAFGQSATAANYWFDNNGATAGFGVADLGSYDWTAGTSWTSDNTGAFSPVGVAWVGNPDQAAFIGAGASTSYSMILGASDASTVSIRNLVLNSDGTNALAIGSGDVVIGGISGTGILSLGSANSIGAAAGTLTINSKYNLGASQSTNFRGGAIIINGVVSGTGTSGVVLASGAFGLTSGTLTLAGDNTFTGTTIVSSGYTLSLKHANALGASGASNTVNSGGTTEVAGGVTINSGESVTIAGNGVNNFGALRAGTGGGTWAGGVALSGSPRIGATAGNTLTVTGTISGSSAFSLSAEGGTGVLIVNPTTTNTYTGATNVIRGILRLGKSDALPTATTLDVDFTGSVSDAATLDLNGFNQTVAALQDSAPNTINGKITNSVASTTSTLTVNQAVNTTYDSIIEDGNGTVVLSKSGAGALRLNGANTHSGVTNILGGILRLGGNLALQNSAFDSASVGTLDTSLVNTPTLGGLIGSTNFALASNVTSLTLNPSNTVTYSGSISGGDPGLSLAKSGAGTQVLSGTNNYAGTTTVNAGALQITTAASVGSSSGFTVNGGRLSLDGGVTLGSGKSILLKGTGTNLFGALQANSGINEWQGNVTVGDGSTRIGVFGGQLTVSGVIDSAGIDRGLTLRLNSGTTLLVLSGANTYVGSTTIATSAGTVQLSGGVNRLPIATKLVLGATGGITGRLDLNGNNQEVAGVSLATGGAGEIKSATAATLTVNTTDPSSYAGLVTGSIALKKNGASSLTLTGANTNSGDITVDAGTLSIGVVNPSNESSTVSIASSGAFLGLDFVGTDTVDKLFIGGVQQPAGSYTSAHGSGCFTGGGTLQVTTGPAAGGFASWIATPAFGTLSDTTPGGDPDNDGMKNLLEYLLNGNPGISDSSILPTLVATGSNFVFNFSRLDSAKSDTVATFQYGSDLAGWTDVVVPTASGSVGAATVVVTENGTVPDTISISIPKGSNTTLFGRLKVVQP